MAHHDEFLNLMSAALDGALSQDERKLLDNHLAQCPDCKALYDQLAAAAKAVQELPPVMPPADLTDRIMTAVHSDKVISIATAPRKQQPWKKWLASAAVLAVIIAGGYGVTQLRSDKEASNAPFDSVQSIVAPKSAISDQTIAENEPQSRTSSGESVQLFMAPTLDSNEPGAAPESVTDGILENTITLTVNGHTFTAALNDSPAAQALRNALPLTLDMTELNGNEKYAYLDVSLPADAQNVEQISAGDLMLFGDNCLVLFYDSFSTTYAYTPLGTLDDPAALRDALGAKGATVTFSTP